MEKYGFVYIWFDRKHKRYYVGSHWGTEDDGYVCSSQWMRRARERRPEDFKRRIIKRGFTDKKSLLIEESRYLKMIKPEELKTRYYNMKVGDANHWSAMYPEYVKTVSEKISHRTKEVMNSPEVRAKMEKVYERARGSTRAPETVEKQRKTLAETWARRSPIEDRYVPSSGEEYSRKLSEASKRMWAERTDEERASIISKLHSADNPRNTGKKASDETRKRMSESQKGRKLTEEHRAKLSKPRRKRTPEERALQSDRIRASWERRKAQAT